MTTEMTDGVGFAMDWPAAPERPKALPREERAALHDVEVKKSERAVRLVIVESGVSAVDLQRAVDGSTMDAVVLGQKTGEAPSAFALRVLRKLGRLHGESRVERADVLVGRSSDRGLRRARRVLALALGCDLGVSDLVFRTAGEAEPEVHDELLELVEAMLENPACRSIRISIRVSGVSERSAAADPA